MGEYSNYTMASISLYGFAAGTPFRCHWMLKELGVDYTLIPVNMAKGEHKTPEYLAINPSGQVPALVHDDVVLTESLAINFFLGETYRPELLGGTPAERAQALRWSIWSQLHLDRHLGTLARPIWTGMHDEPAEEAAREALSRFLPIFEAHIAKAPYILGKEFSVADINVGATFRYADLSSYDLIAYPAILAWRARLAERPAYRELDAKK